MVVVVAAWLLVPVGFWERGGVCIVVDVDVDVDV
jgi:hypothetical protein